MQVVMLLAASLLAMGAGQHTEKPRMTAQDLELAVQRELPDGSDRAQVAAFLKARGISFSDLFEPENIIRAEITRNTKYYAVEGAPIVAQFWFDKQGKLRSHNVREALAGL
jgi:hypothetical protein